MDAIVSKWRYSLAEIEEHLLWLELGTPRRHDRLNDYRAAVRRVSEAEAAMIAAGIPFTTAQERL